MEQSPIDSFEQFNQKVRENIIRERKLHHLSQEDMADLICTSRQSYSNLETGKMEIRLYHIWIISKTFHICPISLLIFNEPPKDEYYYKIFIVLEKIVAFFTKHGPAKFE